MIEWILIPFQFFCRSKTDLCSCGQPRITNLTFVKVWKRNVAVTNSPRCKFCTQKHLSTWAARCDTCHDPICVGEQIAPGLTPDTFVHNTPECSPYPASEYCGYWAEGEVIV